ncbi:MAG: amino acid--tRNA ligase-related protein [Candidatus Paceibacterota bacterium]|jgi:lysyl-tRNA synthetase class 2
MDRNLKSTVNGQAFSGQARLLKKRNLGKIMFWVVRFLEMDVQIVLSPEKLGNFKDLGNLRLGSLFSFSGEKGMTKSGEHSIFVNSLEVNYECPEGLFEEKSSGPERYRSRSLDLTRNWESFSFFSQISEATSSTRNFLQSKGFREFNTGILQRVFEGGLARPFETLCFANGRVMSLSLTSELKLKRLLASGFRQVYEISQSFRNEGVDKLHSPEFTLLEAYSTAHGYSETLSLVESLVRDVILKVTGDGLVQYKKGGSLVTVDYNEPFTAVSFDEVCQNWLGLDEAPSLERLRKVFPDTFTDGMPNFTWIHKLLSKLVTPGVMNPTFVTDLPSAMFPFTRSVEDNPERSEGAILISQGMNIATIGCDESDPKKIRLVLSEQSKKNGSPINEEFLAVLEMGMPLVSGFGLSMNRLFMTFMGDLPRDIRETILYPVHQ